MGKARVSGSCGQFPACRRESLRLYSKIFILRWHLAIPGQTPGFSGGCLPLFIFATLYPGNFCSISGYIPGTFSLSAKRFTLMGQHAVLRANETFCGQKHSGSEHLAEMRVRSVAPVNQHLVVCQDLTLGVGGWGSSWAGRHSKEKAKKQHLTPGWM